MAWILPLLIILLVVLLLSLVWTHSLGAPWVPTPMKLVHKMLRLAEVGPDDLVYDLGCGDGRIIVAAARHYGARAVGVELDPLRYLWCQVLINALGLRDRVQVVFGNFFMQDLRTADVITCYLLRDTNQKLVGKFKNELGPATRVVSNYFTFPGLKLVGEDTEEKIYLYRLKNCE